MRPFNFTAPYADDGVSGPCSCQSDSCLHGGEPAEDEICPGSGDSEPADVPDDELGSIPAGAQTDGSSRLARLWLEVNEGLGRLRRAGLEECERLWDANGTGGAR